MDTVGGKHVFQPDDQMPRGIAMGNEKIRRFFGNAYQRLKEFPQLLRVVVYYEFLKKRIVPVVLQIFLGIGQASFHGDSWAFRTWGNDLDSIGTVCQNFRDASIDFLAHQGARLPGSQNGAGMNLHVQSPEQFSFVNGRPNARIRKDFMGASRLSVIFVAWDFAMTGNDKQFPYAGGMQQRYPEFVRLEQDVLFFRVVLGHSGMRIPDS
jgi:hypothetical protein